MNSTQRREQFRAILAGDQCVHPASVFDPISARIAEDLGFELAFMAGSMASATVLGAPDLVVLTLTEFAEQVRRICRAANISLVVDADHGYGNALNVKRTVEELESAGLAALTIEDTVLPQNFGKAKGEEMISLEEGVGKMKAALAGRQDPSLVIIARTVALRTEGVAGTVPARQSLRAGWRRCAVAGRRHHPGGGVRGACRSTTPLTDGWGRPERRFPESQWCPRGTSGAFALRRRGKRDI